MEKQLRGFMSVENGSKALADIFKAFEEEQKANQQGEPRNPNLPTKVYFNEAKRTSSLIFECSCGCTKDVFTSKASEDDTFDKELGFLVAYFHFTKGGMSKKEVNEQNKALFNKKPEFLKPYLMGVFCSVSGLDLEKAENFINRAIKRSEKHNKKSAK